MEEIHTHLLCLPEQKEFAWEHPGMQKRKKELQICPLALPRSCDSEQKAIFKMPQDCTLQSCVPGGSTESGGSVVWGQGDM